MDAKRIAELIAQVTDLFLADKIESDHHAGLNAALWELAHIKGIREEVDDIFRNDAMRELAEISECKVQP